MAFDWKNFISFDTTKLDKVAFKKWLLSGAQLLEPAVITPGNLDKVLLFDNLEKLSDSIFNQFVEEINNGPLIVGEVAATAGEVSQYLSKFSSVPEETQAILRDNPKLIRRLSKFSEEDQQMIVGNPFLLLALQTLLPLLFEFLLNRFK